MHNDIDMMPEENNNNETVNGSNNRMPEIIEIVDEEDVQFIERDDIVLELTLKEFHKNFNGEEHSFEAFTPSYCERDILLWVLVTIFESDSSCLFLYGTVSPVSD